jgi:hypothetical protein
MEIKMMMMMMTVPRSLASPACIAGKSITKWHLKSIAFWVVMPCNSEKETDISEEHITSFFRVKD